MHVNPENGIHDLPDILTRFDNKGGRIVNEYGDVVSVTQFLEVVSERSGKGPLVRAKIDGSCIGYGAGTWDLIIGDFS